MLTLKQIYEDKDKVIAGLQKKHFAGAAEAVEQVLAFDAQRRAAQQKKDNASAEMNRLSKQIGALIGQGKKDEAMQAKEATAAMKEQIRQFETEMDEAEKAQTALLLTIPNIPYDIVPEGASAEDNLAVAIGNWPNKAAIDAIQKDGGMLLKNWPAEADEAIAQERIADSEKLPHWELAKKYNLIDFDLGVKISGAGFPVYIGYGARLQRALINFFLAEAN